MHHQVTIPGPCVSKIVAGIGKRNGQTISYRSAYGAAIGQGVQLYNVQSVRKCKRRFFSKKCWNENISVPRGVQPHELDAVRNGLDNRIFSAVAQAAQSGRLLRMIRKDKRDPFNGRRQSFNQMNQQRQVLKGVNKSVTIEAIHSMVGQRVAIDKERLFAGKTVRVECPRTGIHRVRAIATSESEYTITVETIAKLD